MKDLKKFTEWLSFLKKKNISLYDFFDWMNEDKIDVFVVKDFFDYQMKYLWVDWFWWSLFLQDFDILTKKWESEEKVIKQRIFDCFLRVLKMNLHYHKQWWLFPFTFNNIINSFFKRIINWTTKNREVSFELHWKHYDLWKTNEIIKQLKKEYSEELDQKCIKNLKECYLNQKKNYEEISKIYKEVKWFDDDEEDDKPIKKRSYKWKNQWLEFQWNIFLYLSRLTFEFNELFVPNAIENWESIKEKHWEIDYTDYWDDEDDVVQVRSNEHQMLIRYFVSMIDWLYWSKTIYVFASEKDLKAMKTYQDYKKFKNKSTRKTKYSFIVSDKIYLLSNTYLFILFDIIQQLWYWDKQYHEYINEIKMILIEKTEVNALTLIELQVLLNWWFYDDLWSKLFMSWFDEYSKEEQEKLKSLLEIITWQSQIAIDDEYEEDAYSTKKENAKKFIEQNLEKFNKEMWIWNYKNSLYNFFLLSLAFKDECWEDLDNVKLKDVDSQKKKIISKQNFYKKYFN